MKNLIPTLIRWRWLLVVVGVVGLLSVLPLTGSAALTAAQQKALDREVAEESAIFNKRATYEATVFFSGFRPLKPGSPLYTDRPRTKAEINAYLKYTQQERKAFLDHIRQERESSPFQLTFFARPVRFFP
jgi:hypothetical protein